MRALNYHITYHMRLGKQLLLLCGLLLVLSITAITFLNIDRQRSELKTVFQKQATALAINAGLSTAQALLERNYAEIETFLLKLEQFDALKQATITDIDNKVIARVARNINQPDIWEAIYDVDQLKLSSTESAKNVQLIFSAYEITVIEPIKAGAVIGYAILDFDLTQYRANERALLFQNLGVAILLLTLSLLILFLFLRRPTNQLGTLAEFATKLVNNEGRLDTNKYTSYELNALKGVLNTVSVQLAESYRQLEASTIRADKANELKSQFLANMSHEIRTPLNGILGMSEVCLSKNVDEDVRGDLTLIQTSAENLLRVVNDILDFSKIEANRLEIDPHPISLTKTIQSVTTPLRRRYVKRGVEFNVAVDDNVPDGIVCDAGRLAQILNNLLSNALKFTEKGEVRLAVSLKASHNDSHAESPMATLLFECSDTGIGIPDAMQANIFDAFTQAEASTTRKFGGTGLGLSISKQLLGLMHSQIHLRSSAGEGSTFWFELTVPVVEIQKESSDGASSHSPQEQSSGLVATRGAAVLIAEDNLVNQKVISHVLGKLGVAIKIVDNGQMALEACQERDFDLIFMDLQMPVMGGLEATQAILSFKPYAKIIGLTADALNDTRDACLNAGMRDFLTKPFKAAQIQETLERFKVAFLPTDLSKFGQKLDIVKAKAQEIQTEAPEAITKLETITANYDQQLFIELLENIRPHIRLFGDMAVVNLLDESIELVKDGMVPSQISLGFLRRNLEIAFGRIALFASL